LHLGHQIDGRHAKRPRPSWLSGSLRRGRFKATLL
jgi:hypothetical protein